MSASSLKVFDIAGAPNDEIDDVRELLNRNGISYYETPRANFGVSVAAIWVNNEKECRKARQLIEGYQKERIDKIRSNRGKPENNSSWWKRKEIYFLVFIVILLIWMMAAGITRP